jgi:hypothetical protein
LPGGGHGIAGKPERAREDARPAARHEPERDQAGRAVDGLVVGAVAGEHDERVGVLRRLSRELDRVARGVGLPHHDLGAPGERGGPNGDLYVTVAVAPHRLFGRTADNLTLTVPVTFAEAALGGVTEIYVARFRNVKEKHPDFLRGYGFQGGAWHGAEPGLRNASGNAFRFRQLGGS